MGLIGQLDPKIGGSLGLELDGIQGAEGTLVVESDGTCDRPLDLFAKDAIIATTTRSQQNITRGNEKPVNADLGSSDFPRVAVRLRSTVASKDKRGAHVIPIDIDDPLEDEFSSNVSNKKSDSPISFLFPTLIVKAGLKSKVGLQGADVVVVVVAVEDAVVGSRDRSSTAKLARLYYSC
jgi:hypothetical protein